ncbi:hypothetical protein JTB14_011438 [Gonioctena quinquepunctata]|nr:hypothetical protein JTB14_011438 [Gonioctena quinquepunctata]
MEWLYTLHLDFGSGKEGINIIPAVYSPLPGKKTQTYERFIKIDFEEAVIMAIKRILPNVKIAGCNFHFNQCLWRKVQSIGLVEGHGNDGSIRLHIQMCASLAFFPVSDVVDGWLVIMENAPNGTQIDLFNTISSIIGWSTPVFQLIFGMFITKDAEQRTVSKDGITV